MTGEGWGSLVRESACVVANRSKSPPDSYATLRKRNAWDSRETRDWFPRDTYANFQPRPSRFFFPRSIRLLICGLREWSVYDEYFEYCRRFFFFFWLLIQKIKGVRYYFEFRIMVREFPTASFAIFLSMIHSIINLWIKGVKYLWRIFPILSSIFFFGYWFKRSREWDIISNLGLWYANFQPRPSRFFFSRSIRLLICGLREWNVYDEYFQYYRRHELRYFGDFFFWLLFEEIDWSREWDIILVSNLGWIMVREFRIALSRVFWRFLVIDVGILREWNVYIELRCHEIFFFLVIDSKDQGSEILFRFRI